MRGVGIACVRPYAHPTVWPYAIQGREPSVADNNRYGALLEEIGAAMGEDKKLELDALVGERMGESMDMFERLNAPEVVRAQRFELIDDAGNLLAVLGE